jgi:hypothetical protein
LQLKCKILCYAIKNSEIFIKKCIFFVCKKYTKETKIRELDIKTENMQKHEKSYYCKTQNFIKH